MAIELHLPDLPDVPVSLGPAARPPRPQPPRIWHVWLRDQLSAYLPLLLMLLLALGTWWLVKSTPHPAAAGEKPPPRAEPDYTMDQFVVERFYSTGQLKLRIEGLRMRHYPDTGRVEVDEPKIRAVSPEGRITLAQAKRAISNADGSEVQLLGDAEVDSDDPRGVPVRIRSDFLHVFLDTERLRTDLPVIVNSGSSRFRADGIDYDNLSGVLKLQGRTRAVLQPTLAQPKPSG